MVRNFFALSIALVLLFGATACSASSPRQIAAYPQDQSKEISTYSQPDPSVLIYNAYLEIEVFDPASAAGSAKDYAESYGGYLISSQTYHWDGRDEITVVLAVPAHNYEKLAKALKRLGKVKAENISSEWQEDGWSDFSEVTVAFKPSALALPSISTGWDPGRTFRQALHVFVTIFGFLADIGIWIVVVLGPFVLMAWGGWQLLRRLGRKAKP